MDEKSNGRKSASDAFRNLQKEHSTNSTSPKNTESYNSNQSPINHNISNHGSEQSGCGGIGMVLFWVACFLFGFFVLSMF